MDCDSMYSGLGHNVIYSTYSTAILCGTVVLHWSPWKPFLDWAGPEVDSTCLHGFPECSAKEPEIFGVYPWGTMVLQGESFCESLQRSEWIMALKTLHQKLRFFRSILPFLFQWPLCQLDVCTTQPVGRVCPSCHPACFKATGPPWSSSSA